jgi:N-6 DNA Methylase
LLLARERYLADTSRQARRTGYSVAFDAYIEDVQKNLLLGNATEHTHGAALGALLESLEPGLTATNEPKRMTDVGAPDYILTRRGVPLGYVEAKDVGVDLRKTERTDQLKRYKAALPNLILTDYLEFRHFVNGEHRSTARIVEEDGNGRLRVDGAGAEEAERLLRNFLATAAPSVGTPRELAERMAARAREIRDLIVRTFEQEGERRQLHQQLAAFRGTLIPDLKPEQFADMYAQTIAYGLFAARTTTNDPNNFSRKTAGWDLPRTNPFLRNLFNEIAGLSLDERVAWIVDDLAELLRRADMAAILEDFGQRTRREDPVVHFYETVLAAYDPKMRESRGVYYTPEPVVSYIVRSVDAMLKEKFGRPLGLADPNTLILDPATGTATFLYYVFRHIYEELQRMGQLGTWSTYVRENLLPRVFGFELLMAPYTIAHMKLGVLLRELGYDFGGDDRLRLYLTNTLEEGFHPEETIGFAEYIAEEADAAASVKKDEPIEVIFGNPPYSGHSANKGA